MMKTKLLYYLGLISCLFSSCSPYVSTSILKTYPQTVEAKQIRVFEKEDSIPVKCDTLGNIIVSNSVPAAGNRDKKLLPVACKTVAKAGGDAFVITNEVRYSFYNDDIIQLSGTALRMNNDSMNTQPTNYAFYETGIVKNVRRTNAPPFSASAYFGGGLIVSKVITDKGIEKGIGGMNWRIACEYIFNNGLGLELQYSGARTNTAKNFKMTQIYAAPVLVYKGGVNNWLVKIGFGFGYYGLKREDKSLRMADLLSGVGFNLECGVEYMLTRHVGLGGLIYLTSGHLPNKDNLRLKDNEYSGVGRFDFSVGLHYYF